MNLKGLTDADPFILIFGGLMNDSQLYLLANVEIDADNEFTIDFDNATAQQTYFQSKISDVLDTTGDFSYIRKDADVKVEKSLEDLLSVNYLMFKNDSKWWYARITNKEYISPTTTRIYFEIDAFQTFMFDFEIQESFVEREHQDRFTPELKPLINSVSENVDYGSNYELSKVEKIISKRNNTAEKYNVAWAIIVCNDKLSDDSATNSSALDNYYYYAVPFESPQTRALRRIFYFNSGDSYTQLENAEVITKIIARDNATKIVSIKLYENCPFYVKLEDYSNNISLESNFVKVVSVSSKNILNITSTIEKTITNDDSLRELSTIELTLIDNVNLDINSAPKIEYETKLYSDPYYFILMTNHNGEGLKINPKGLADITKIPIYYIPVCSPDSKIMYYIKGYYGDNEGRYYNYIDNSVNEIALTSDKWQEYLSQNKASAVAGVAVNLGTSALTTAIGAITANPLAIAGGVLSLGQNVANTIIRQQDIKQEPNSVKSQGNNASFTLVRQIIGLELEYYTITDANKKRLFNYFNHYGYQCNDFKKPNLRSRYYFNYLRTIGINIKSNIDSIYVNELKSMFNNGVTIWHYRDSNTWKGTNNYDYENAEMNLISTEAENG